LDRTQNPSGRFQKQAVIVEKLRLQGGKLAAAGAVAACAAGNDWQVVEAVGGGGKLLRRQRLEVNLQLWSASVKIRAEGTRVLVMPLVVVGDTVVGSWHSL